MRLAALSVALLCFGLLNVDYGFGQAIVGYGINAGRAGAAGAGAGAAGAGAAGIFKRLGDRMGSESKTKGARTARTAEPEFDAKDLEQAKAKREEPAFENSGTIKTKSGVKISGVPTWKASPTRVRYAPRSYDYSPSPSASAAPASPQPAVTEQTDAAPVPTGTETATANEQATATTAADSPEAGTDPVAAAASAPADSASGSASVPNARTSSGTSADEAVTNPNVQRALEVDSEIADIAAGTQIDDLVARFGKPLFKMAGLAGQGYNEKYIFRAPDGRRFTVFAQDGAVAEVMIEPAEIAAL